MKAVEKKAVNQESGGALRALALRFIQAAVFGSVREEQEIRQQALTLSSLDRALYEEISLGVLREWFFLEEVIGKFVKKSPSRTIGLLLKLSIYQLLFLDRVPAHAVYSETKKIGKTWLKLSEPELKFVHGVLKSIERNSDSTVTTLLKNRKTILEELKTGRIPKTSFDWAVMNSNESIVRLLAKNLSDPKPTQDLAFMKTRSQLIGYLLPAKETKALGMELAQTVVEEVLNKERNAGATFRKNLENTSTAAVTEDTSDSLFALDKPQLQIAAYAKTFSAKHLHDPQVVIQGLSSQWACLVAAEKIKSKLETQKEVRVLELASGKGGKLLGTLTALTHLFGSAKGIPIFYWLAQDPSSYQSEQFYARALPIVQKLWPQIKVEAHFGQQKIGKIAPVKEKVSSSEGGKSSKPSEFKLSEADFIWFDAPCSGLGTLSKLPQISVRLALEKKPKHKIKALAQVQKEVSENTIKQMRNGSLFFYTVCTLTLAETTEFTKHLQALSNSKLLLEQTIHPSQVPYAEGFYGCMFEICG